MFHSIIYRFVIKDQSGEPVFNLVKGEGSFGCFSCCTSSCCGNNVEFEILSVETGEAVS